MCEYICGKNAVVEALEAGRAINRLYLEDGKNKELYHLLIALCKERDIPYSFVEAKKLEQLAGKEHRGVVASVAEVDYCEVADILLAAQTKGEAPLVVMLSEVEDPHNLGAIMRTAVCLGVHGLIIPKRRSVAVNATVARVAAGAAEYLPVARVPNLTQAADELKKAGLWLVAADMQGDSIYQSDFSGPLCIVLGGEDKGIAPLLLKQCDFKVTIPMEGAIGSVNVSAAAAIFINEARRTRLLNPSIDRR